MSTSTSKSRSWWRDKAVVISAQFALLVAFLAAWQWLPTIPAVRHTAKIFDPFYISSPKAVGVSVWRLMGLGSGPVGTTGATGTIWGPLWHTLEATLIGTIGGVVLGLIVGVLLSESRTAERILRPYIVALNAIPRIALVPIIIIVFGPTATADGVSSLLIVVFIIFYNAFQGARSVKPNVVRSASLLGAGRGSVMLRIRLPYATAWTFAVLPTAVSFGLVGAVTTELFSGGAGVGGLLQVATNTVNATFTVSIVVLLSAVGVILVALTTLVQRRLLHWWETS
jgi:NitT/TauT family transport system permease protein